MSCSTGVTGSCSVKGKMHSVQTVSAVSRNMQAMLSLDTWLAVPAASLACRAFLAPGMGTAPLQMVQLIATYRGQTKVLIDR